MSTAEIQHLREAIAHLETQRTVIGSSTVDAAVASILLQIAALEKEQSDPQASPSLNSADRRQVTVMFADLSGFTHLAEESDPETVRDLINACFACLVPVIERYGGVVDKFIGDGIMALFGAPVTHENDPERSLLAALEMQKNLAEFNAQRQINLDMHFGINTGLVIAGKVGVDHRQEYSVVGDAVNLASRLEEFSQPGEILIGSETWRQTAALFEFERLVPLQIQGKTEPVSIYRLLGAKERPIRQRSLSGRSTSLIGRRNELNTLRTVLEHTAQGNGGIITLTGEAGVGKSRLVSEAHQTWFTPPTNHPSLLWVEGYCLSHNTSTAYSLWIDLLHRLFSLNTETKPTLAGQKLKQQINDLCPARVTEIYSALISLLSLPSDIEKGSLSNDSDSDNSDSEEGAESGILPAMRDLLRCKAAQIPLVIVCEDLHWADRASMDLLKNLLPLSQQAPILFICIFRSSSSDTSLSFQEMIAQAIETPYDNTNSITHISLRPLSNEQSSQLVSQLLQINQLPEQLNIFVLKRTEGNPFYMEEIVRSLVDQGSLNPYSQADNWLTNLEQSAAHIPDTLQGVIMARIDRLPGTTRRILQLAAVLGRVFYQQILAAIIPEQTDLAAHLAYLENEELIEKQPDELEPSYLFKHHLTQEAAYDSLLKQERAIYHERVASAIKELYPDRLEEHAGLLAYHWQRAGEDARAIPHLQNAAEQAIHKGAYAEAQTHLLRMLELARSANLVLAQANALSSLGHVCRFQRDYIAAQAYIEQALPIYRLMSNRGREVGLTIDLGIILQRQGKFIEAQELFNNALYTSRQTRNRRGEVSVLINLGKLELELGDLSAANACLEQAARMARAMHSRWNESYALNQLAVVYQILGKYPQARACLEEIILIDQHYNNQRSETLSLCSLAEIAWLQGDYRTAYEYACRTQLTMKKILGISGQAYATWIMALTLEGQGQIVTAEQTYQEALALAQKKGNTPILILCQTGLARIHLANKQLKNAVQYTDEILEYLQIYASTPTIGLYPYRELAVPVYLVCYQVLAANHDRRASSILKEAYLQIQARAAKIKDENVRQCFLHQPPAHQAILNIWQEQQSENNLSILHSDTD